MKICTIITERNKEQLIYCYDETEFIPATQQNQDCLTRLIVRTSHIFELYFVTTELNFPACRFDP